MSGPMDIFKMLMMGQQAGAATEAPQSPMMMKPDFIPSETNAAPMVEPSNNVLPPGKSKMKLKSLSMENKTGGGSNVGKSYQAQLEEAFGASMNQRGAALEMLKTKMAEEEAAKPTGLSAINLKPFMAFGDQMSGSKSAAQYDAPTAPAEHTARLNRLQDAVSKESNGLSDDQLAFLKMRASNEAEDSKLKMTLGSQERSMGKAQTNNEFRLREKWDADPITKNSKVIDEAYQKIEQGHNSNDPADYLTMIYGLMKMQDPGSTVREGEFKAGEGIGGWPAQWQSQYRKATGDQRGPISQLQKTAILNQAKMIREAQRESQGRVDGTYKSMANDYGFNPNRVVLDVFSKQGRPSQPQASNSVGGKKSPDEMNEAELRQYLGE